MIQIIKFVKKIGSRATGKQEKELKQEGGHLNYLYCYFTSLANVPNQPFSSESVLEKSVSVMSNGADMKAGMVAAMHVPV